MNRRNIIRTSVMVVFSTLAGLLGCVNSEPNGNEEAQWLAPTPLKATPVVIVAPPPQVGDPSWVVEAPIDANSDCGPQAFSTSKDDRIEYILEWLPDGDRLLFSAGNSLWSIQTNGVGLSEILDAKRPDSPYPTNPRYGFYADLSPDGSSVVYSTCSHMQAENGGRRFPVLIEPYGYEIAVIALGELGSHKITDNDYVDHYPAWSPDGTKIAYVAVPPGDLLTPSLVPRIGVAPADGSGPGTFITNAGDLSVGFYPPVWSPRGDSLAFIAIEGDEQIHKILYLVEPDGSRLMRIGETTALPAWTPDGDRLAVATMIGGKVVIQIVNSTGGKIEEISLIGPLPRSRPISQIAWAPDGLQLLLWSNGVFVMDTYDRQVRRLKPVTKQGVAAWSPDGARLALLGPKIGLLVVNQDSSEPRLLASIAQSNDRLLRGSTVVIAEHARPLDSMTKN